MSIGFSVVTDEIGNVYMTGSTASTSGLATPDAPQTTNGGGNDAFLVKFDSAGARIWATYYGGSGTETGATIILDGQGNIYMTGNTTSVSGIATTGAYQTFVDTILGVAFLTKFTICSQPVAVIISSGNTIFCQGDSVTLTSDSNGSYLWNNGAGTQSITVAQSGLYSVTVTIANDCSASALQDVIVNPIVVTQISQSVCAGQTYIFNNQKLTTSGTYTETLQTTTGCDSIVTLTITFDSLPHPTLTRSSDTLQTQAFTSYQWLRNGVDISSATTQSITIQQNGNYSVVVTGPNGCSDTSSVLNVTTLGVQDSSRACGIKLYPNPSTGSIILEFTDNVMRDVEITDAIGRTVMACTRVSRKQNFDLAQLSAGVYIIRINQQGQVQSLKFTLVR